MSAYGENRTLIRAAECMDRASDPALVKAVARGHVWFEELTSGRAESIREIAHREGLTDRYVTRLLDLAFLPPTVVDDILNGRQPVDMTAERLSRAEHVMLWAGRSKTFALT